MLIIVTACENLYQQCLGSFNIQSNCDYANAIYPCLGSVRPSCDTTEFQAVLAVEDAARDQTIVSEPGNCGLPLPTTTPAPSCFNLLNSCVQYKDTGSTDPCQMATNIESCLNELTSLCSEADLQVVSNNQGPYITQLIQQDSSGQQCFPFCMNVFNQCYDTNTVGVADPCQQAGVIDPCLGTILQDRLCPYDVIGNVYNAQIVVKEQLVAQDPNGCQTTTTQTTTTAEPTTTTTTEPTTTTTEPTTTTAEPTTTTAEPTTTTAEPTTTTAEPTTTTAEPTTTTAEPTTTTTEPTTTTAEPTTTTAEPTTTTAEPTTTTAKPTTITAEPTTTTAEPTTTAKPTTTTTTIEPTTQPPSGVENCAAGSLPCIYKFQQDEYLANGSIPLICVAVDQTISCIKNKSSGCDPVAAADVIQSMNGVIEQYTVPPYSCILENQVEELDGCPGELANCTELLNQAKQQTDASESCRLNEDYKNCMTDRTTSCDADIQVTIDKNIQDAVTFFQDRNYFCDERLVNNLTVCDTSYNNCNSKLQPIGNTVFSSTGVCRIADDFNICVEEMAGNCTTQIKNFYLSTRDNIVSSFDQKPYFCADANACLTLFNDCNNTLSQKANTDCELMNMYDICLTSISPLCDAQKFANLSAMIEQIQTETRSQDPHICTTLAPTTSTISTTNAASTTDASTTTPTTELPTTTEKPSGVENCAAGSLPCIYKFQQDEYLANGSVPLICSAVDETISCIKNKSSGCDPVAAADVMQSMNGVIEQYTVPPYSCTLENQVEELDGCPGELANCTELLNQAKQQTDPDEACRLNDDYKNCMTNRTPSCDFDIQVTIDKNIQDAETFFKDRNYFCNERLVNNLTECDTGFQNCNQKLNVIGRTIFTALEVCPVAGDFNTCVDEMAGNCTTQIKNFYLTTRDNIVSSFDQKPYFCSDENACLTLFNDCNDTLSPNTNTDCELMNTYDICLNSISPLCAAQQLANLTAIIGKLQNDTREQDPYYCTTTVAPSTSTTVPSTTSGQSPSASNPTTTTTELPSTTEVPSGVENCAAGSLPCIYKFQQDEYLANGSVPLICSAVDETISCIKNKSSGCDPVAAVDVMQSMNGVIEQYTVPPYSCTLENQVEELDGCPGELANCTELLNQAKQQTDPDEACRLNDDYKNCMTNRTPSCDADIQVTIDKNIQDAETFFQDRNYFCDERLVNNLTECDTGYQNCNQKLNVIGRTIFTAVEICPVADGFNACVDEMAGNCTTQIKNFYLTTRDNIISSFDQKPYFCSDENACLTLFNDCNDTLSPNTNTDCELMNTYDICLNSISPLCEAQQLANLTASIGKLQNDTRENDPYYCTTTVAPSTQTTVPSTSTTTSGQLTSTSSTSISEIPTTTEQPSGVENCAAGSLPCINKFQQDEYLANRSVPLICLAVDETISCIKNKSSGCDPVAAADVIQSMNGVIEQYTVPPYSCILENKVEELDGCPGELANCTEFLNQAKQATDLSAACGLSDDYKSCMKNNTPSCDVTIQNTINKNIEDADQYFTDRNYFCDERLVNNLTTCDESYKECNLRLQPIGRDALTSTDVCPIADDFQVCIDEMMGNCTTKIRAFYTNTAINIRASFNRRPYFCDDADACYKLFADCNDTLSGSAEGDCGLLPIYRTCLSSISPICDVEQFSNLTTKINQIVNDTIDQDPYQCIPTTMMPSTTTSGVSTTTAATSTTTERPTGLAYCAGESMICINQFNQDEFLANGTVSLICQAVDRTLSCIANKTSTCDPISAATIANSMSGIIEGYKGPPNNCSLENSDNPAFQLDVCSKALADCDEVLTEAKAQFDVNDGCRMNDEYKSCMRENTTDCDVSFVDSINQNIQQADLYFIQRNYFCQERIANNLTECDAAFRNCNTIIQDIGRTVTKSQEVCQLAERFDICRANMTDACTPQISEFYTKNAKTSSERFTGVPFFCGLENGCQKLFDDCNETLGSSNLEPCGFLPIYRTCLTSISDICDVEQFSNLTTRINQIENDTIEQDPNNCIPTTTAIPSTSTLSTTTERPTGLAYCASESMVCINHFNQDEFLANGTVSLICQAVDKALSCIANKTSTCDPISAATVANSMSGIIEGYKGPPNNCSLENSDNPAFKLDGCTKALADCDEVLTEAKAQFDANDGCRMNEKYTNCMRENTTDCDVSFVDSINQNIQQADLYFIQRNYFCQERIFNNLTECDAAFRNCNSIIQDIGRTVTKSQEVCKLAEEFNVCRTNMTDSCTLQIGEFYNKNAETSSERFTGVPFFCGLENGCEKLFDNCNETLGSNNLEPCGFLPIYRTCLTSIYGICDAEQFSNLTIRINQIDNDTIEQDPNNCIPTTTAIPSTSTLSERPTGLAYCAGESMICINQFNQDEFLANGTVYLICEAVDRALSCVANKTSTCDPISAATIANSMSGIIEGYQGPPNNCSLENSNNPAFKLDGCTKALADCDEKLTEAKTYFDVNEGCRTNEEYKSGMRENTTDCDVSFVDSINQNIQQADLYFIQRNYFCQERIANNLTECDAAFRNCNSIIQNIGRTVTKSQEVCKLAEEFNVCRTNMTDACTPQIGEFYSKNAETSSERFTGVPFFCGLDNGCQKLFDDCNNTLGARMVEPCSFLPIYRTCLSSISDICDAVQFSNLTARINQIENDTIEQDPNECIPTTLPPPTTTTERPTGLAYCAGESMVCINQFNQDEFIANGTVSLICQAVDKALSCIANRTSTCDPISAATVANSMSGIIEGYQGPPNNCSLENSDNPAFKLDSCTKVLADCDEKLTEAKTNFDVNEGCRINEVYTNCMRVNTTDCDVSFVDSINQNIQQADLYFIQRNYFCQERIANNLTECDASFRNCNSIIQDIGRTVTKSQEVCKLAEEFNTCRTDMTDSCTPQIGEFYSKNAETSSERFTGIPFFCGSDNGCQKLFDDCNNTLGARMVQPCGFLPIYRTCLSSISGICDAVQYLNLTNKINQIENDTIEQDPNNCIPTTTPPPTTTTERPTGLAYCAGESMVCINQFNQDEFIANGTVSLICQAVDRALSCVTNKTSSCDPISAATIAKSMSGIIQGYQGPPNNCSLENSDNPAFQLDGCTKVLADCDKKLTEAKTNFDVNEGCRINEEYTSCMRENTTDCDVSFVDSINQNIEQADLYFIQRNYFCQERNSNNLTECDAAFRNCNSIIKDIGRTVTKSQEVCQLAEEFNVCRTNMTNSCTPQIGEFYNQNAETSSERFTGVPFFCGSDNGCQKVFDDCNNTLGARMVEPCGFLPIYRTCLSSISGICDAVQYLNLTNKINQIENDTIEQDPNNCIPTTTPPPTTTQLPTTTTKRPTGLAYCAGESMICINQFNQDEFLANGTVSLICESVDRALSCIANKTSTCDPISAATIANSMSGIIEGYKGPPNNCSLENSDNPAFQLDGCTKALADCDKKLTEAKTNVDVNAGCRMNEEYTNCMRENTTDCDASFVNSIDQNIQQADIYFIQRNYFCQERIANNLTECDSAYRACNYILKDIGRTVTKSQDVCKLAEEFNLCRTSMTDSCTPQIGQFYSNNAEISSERFTGIPFFCGSDNGCQKVFDDCNNTLGARMVEPCGFLPIHRVCLSSIANICDVGQFTELQNKIDQIENDTVENDPNQCIPTTTFPTTTLDPNRKLNTTECNKAILPCYNEFQTAEFKANGDSTLICSVFDNNVKCITDLVERCDLLAVAEVKKNLQLNTDYYNSPPHKCNIETTLKLDDCSKILAECSKIRDKSQMTNDPELACSLLEDYKSCMTANASICDETYTDIIQDNIQSTEKLFIDGKYFCDERKESNQSVCDSAYNNCYSKLSPVGVLVVQSDLVCPLADEYVSCVDDMLGKCSQNIGNNYKDIAMNIRKSFNNAPYMCNAENPCQAMFDFCNTTEASQVQDPCDLPTVYETCFNSMAMVCNKQQMDELSAKLEAESIKLKIKCAETTPTPLNIVTRNPKFQQRPIGRRPGFLPVYGVTPGHMEEPHTIIQDPENRPINRRPYPNQGGYTPGVVQFPIVSWSTGDPGPTPKQPEGSTIKVPIQWPDVTKNPPLTLPPKRHNSEPGYVQEASVDGNGTFNPKPTEWTKYYGNNAASAVEYSMLFLVIIQFIIVLIQ